MRLDVLIGDAPVATVPTACGIETSTLAPYAWSRIGNVATVPTACGIETLKGGAYAEEVLRLQQYLPLAVLKH